MRHARRAHSRTIWFAELAGEGGPMARTPFARRFALGLGAWLIAATAQAQLTTGTVTGTVKDSQGGLVPGAAVTLISESRGTQLPEAFTNTSGDFVVPNVPPDTYTIQVTMQGFKTLRRRGIDVSAGDHVGLGTISIEIGGL